ncbi:Kelch repeat-containing protein [Hyalangium minutum]|uniref:High-affinity leucine-specific transport system, periplasmic binding protein LivK n=1 Tax=Hyalangium minutum TaxID=394096 RepID=A0A085WCA3_9BACT|nr:kelch repeat-containing protein [Hyalangium minutum]KFE65316.1 High-affinity leucine-specific transport system, periplasmic binding protein LivK [Hyalangium minutum]
MKRTSSYLLLAVGLALFAGCSDPSSSNTGSAQLAASVPQALSASDVTRVKVTVSAAGMTSLVVDLAKSNGTWGGVIGSIPAGANRTFLAEAFDSTNAKRFQGQVSSITITANQTTAVALTLQELVPPPPYGNDAPLINSVVANVTTVQTGGAISLTATAQDPNAGDTLTYLWTATGGTFSTPAAANTSWTAPASASIQTLTLTVTDSQGAAASISLAVNVIAGTSAGTANLSITFNLFPVVSKVTASRTRVDVGQPIALTATASDADADAMTYQWGAVGCTGTWSNATSSAATFVPSAIPSSACHNCQLTVTVQDGRGGQGSGTINLCVAAATTERFPPLFTNSYQSATTTAPAQTVSFNVTALDPQSSAMTFSWVSSIGTLGTAQNTASTSQVVWTAPSCAVTGVPVSITAFATNAYGVFASKTFSVTGLPACASGWSTGASMLTSRSNHSATLLSSGKVLVVGGYNNNYLASAELYDPATNTWSAAGVLTSRRRYHTATLLPSGKVLIAGGTDGGVLASAELYDPVTNSWSAAAPMGTTRQNATATLLASGKVLVAGGINSGFLNSVELYDPATNSWSNAAPMSTMRTGHTATFLPASGKVLVTGGNTYSGVTNSVELYNPTTNSWTTVAPLNTARNVHAAAALASGKVIVTGGYNGASYFNNAEVYDPSTNTWTSGSTFGARRQDHTATALASGKVLLTGGYYSYYNDDEDNGTVFHDATSLYDPGSNTWSSGGTLPGARAYHTATLLPSGRVFVTGGYSNSGFLGTSALYTP